MAKYTSSSLSIDYLQERVYSDAMIESFKEADEMAKDPNLKTSVCK